MLRAAFKSLNRSVRMVLIPLFLAGTSSLAVAQSAKFTQPMGTDQNIELLAKRLMLALPLEAEQKAILKSAESDRPKLQEKYPARRDDIATAFSELKNCLRTGTDIDARRAIERGLLELEPSELAALVTLYESDTFKNLSEMIETPNTSLEARRAIAEIVARPEVKKFYRVVLAAGLEQGLSSSEPTEDQDCRGEHDARVLALGRPQRWTDMEAKLADAESKWGFVLSPVYPSTEASDGSIQIWHSRRGRHSYSTREACMEAAQEGLKHLAGDAWNYKASCTSPFNELPQLTPVQVDNIEAEKLEK